MRFAYIGPEAEVEIFGLRFKQGEPVHVEDRFAAAKLSVHPQFVSDGGDVPAAEPVAATEPVVMAKRRGRPPKVHE